MGMSVWHRKVPNFTYIIGREGTINGEEKTKVIKRKHLNGDDDDNIGREWTSIAIKFPPFHARLTKKRLKNMEDTWENQKCTIVD